MIIQAEIHRVPVVFISNIRTPLLLTELSGPRQVENSLRTCAKCTYSDYRAHAQSIIRAFALHSYILYPTFLIVDSESPDSLRGCAGWSVPVLFAYARRHVFAGPNMLKH